MNRLPSYKTPLKILFILVMAFGVFTNVTAQESGPTVTISDVDASEFPIVSLVLSAADANGLPITNLTPANIQIIEEGRLVSSNTVSLQTQTTGTGGSHVVLALDISAEASVLNSLKQTILTFLDTLNPQDAVAIVVFHDEIAILENFTTDKTTLREAITGLTPTGTTTALNAGVLQAVELLNTIDNPNKAVIAITNSGDNVGKTSVNQVIDRANALDVPIYTIGYGGSVSNVAQMQNLASLTGGQTANVASASNVAPELEPIMAQFNQPQEYFLTFQSGLVVDGAPHTATINLNIGGTLVATETTITPESGDVAINWAPLDSLTLVGVRSLGVQIDHATPIEQIQFLINGAPLLAINAEPYTFDLDTASIPPDTYHLLAIATDTEGNRGLASLIVEIAAPTTPSVTVIPVDNQVTVGDSITIRAEIDTPIDIAIVEFLFDGEVIGTANAPPYSVTISSSDYDVGQHQIVARARDIQGTWGESNDTPIGLNPPPRTFWTVVGPYVGKIMALMFFMLIPLVLLFAILILRYVFNTTRRHQNRNFIIELFNGGNTNNRYTLQADESTGELAFQFLHNDRDLQQKEREQTTYETVTETVRAPQRAVQPVPVRATPQPVAAGQPQQRPSVSGKDLSAKADAAKKGASLLSNALSTLSFLLPGSAGASARAANRNVRQAQGTVQRAEMAPKRVSSIAGQVSGGAIKVPTGGESGPAERTPLPSERIQMEQEAQAARQSGRRQSYAPAASQQPRTTTRTSTRARKSVETVRLKWAETPIVNAGENIRIDLLVTPSKQLKTYEYTFSILSRMMDSENKPRTMQQGHIKLTPPNWSLRLLPWLTGFAAFMCILAITRLIVIVLSI